MSEGAISSSQSGEIGRLCEAFRSAWATGPRPRIETYVEGVDASVADELLERLVALELNQRIAAGDWPSRDDYLGRFPGQTSRVLNVYREVTAGPEPTEAAEPTWGGGPRDERAGPQVEPGPGRSEPAARGHGDAADLAGAGRLSTEPDPIGPPAREGRPEAGAGRSDGRQPVAGRFHVIKPLGKGSFGRVSLAHDSELDREVALKFINPGLVGSKARCDALVNEARSAAKLRHPGIVTVHDIGYDRAGEVFLVLDYIPGETLAVEFARGRPTPARLAGIMVRVADAVNHAHVSGLVHRDLKPSNILIDLRGIPFVADFGLALSEESQRLRSGEVAGTPSYMAPEQVRGEVHRLDGRTDVWALGIILYEGMAGRLPFGGHDRDALYEEIQARDPKPVRQIDDRLPRELERIALKCLAKRMTDRYQTAADLAEDLRAWVESGAGSLSPTSSSVFERGSALGVGQRARVVLRGLRAFDTEDADFFLSLLPGPKDRDGLPDSIRHWKARIEARGRDQAFPVGLMYGPSGCGKSSMVKAGLLPGLAEGIRPIYVEATPGTTEARLLAALRRAFPGLPTGTSLAEVTAAIREGTHGPATGKVLLVIDQFEQWLQAHAGLADSDLVRALRQADGRRLQVILLVRDDFWMAVVRFMRALEVPLVEGGNSAAVELFDAAHARKVLIELGRAGGNLPPEPASPGPEAGKFLDRAVAELGGKDGRVVPVRLILFAEVVRHRPWTAATLSDLGGIEGIGVTFLEETFSETSSPPTHRYHRAAAQGVLKALLPESTSILKGGLRGALELQKAAGYVDRPGDFDELMNILDAELRLVTPSDPEGLGIEGRESGQGGRTYYQLTHDYLIPPLRAWLHRARQGTRRGRAETRLELLTALWRERPGSRQLPSLVEWLGIALYVNPRSWAGDAGRMMRSAARHHLIRGAALGALMLALAGGAWYFQEKSAAESLLGQSLKADWAELARFLPEIKQRRDGLRAALEHAEARPFESGDRARKVAGALLFLDRPGPERANYLHQWLGHAETDEMLLLLKVFSEHPDQAGAGRLLGTLRDDAEVPAARLRAACVLAAVSPDRDDWESSSPVIVQALMAEDRRDLALWLDYLGPMRLALRHDLEFACQKPGLNASDRLVAAEALTGILEREGDVLQLARSVVRVLPEPSTVLLRSLSRMDRAARIRDYLTAVVERREDAPTSGWDGDEGLLRRSNAAIGLLVLDWPAPVWPLLRLGPDPTLRTELIRRIGEASHLHGKLLSRFQDSVSDGGERQALLLALAESNPGALPPNEREECAEAAERLFRDAPEPGVHSAAELLLRRLGRPATLEEDARSPSLAPGSSPSTTGEAWYRGPNGHTFAVLAAPLKFWMGSPLGEENRGDDYYRDYERRHLRRIDRRLAVSTTEVTHDQYKQFNPSHTLDQEHATGDGTAPAHKFSWYDAARYCNKLSELAGIPKEEWCYPEPIGPGMSLPADSVDRRGYRMPTEAEWEAFARASAETCRPFGRDVGHLPRYGWTWLNSGERIHPVGQLLPNDYGLFDTLGNVWEWCHDGPVSGRREPFYPTSKGEDPTPDAVAVTVFDADTGRMLRGGSFDYAPSWVRPGRRYCDKATANNQVHYGFRVIQTLPIEGPARGRVATAP